MPFQPGTASATVSALSALVLVVSASAAHGQGITPVGTPLETGARALGDFVSVDALCDEDVEDGIFAAGGSTLLVATTAGGPLVAHDARVVDLPQLAVKASNGALVDTFVLPATATTIGAAVHLTCFNHSVNGDTPAACTGTVMFHDIAGIVIQRATYALDPGQSRSFQVAPPVLRAGGFAGVIPCVLPDPGAAAAAGRAIPNVEIVDGGGSVVLLINPAGVRASQFERLATVR